MQTDQLLKGAAAMLLDSFMMRLAILTAALICSTQINARDAAPHPFNNRATAQQPPLRIAHAGGGYKGLTYTNSLEALEHNAERYDLFELDFNFTSDGFLVCIHDWEENAKATFGKTFSPPPTLAQFEQETARASLNNCTLGSLIGWLRKHPSKRIVTDIKSGNLRALTYIASQYPQFVGRFIPQIYFPAEYSGVARLGYRDIIWTLYRSPVAADRVIDNARSMKLYAVTMPTNRAPELAKRLGDLGIRTYVHTVNAAEELAHFKSLGISEIYTDWLPPRQ